jgi:hypothetical protein
MIGYQSIVKCAAMLLAGTLPATAVENHLANAGFESPAEGAGSDSDTVPEAWTWFSSLAESRKIGLTGKLAQAGKQSVRLASQGKAASYQGLFQMLPAESGVTFEFSAHVRNDGANPLKGEARGQLSVEWKDAAGQEIERQWGADWGESLSATRWTKVEMIARAPAHAATAHFVITQFDGKDEKSGGAFLVDEAVVVKRR